LKSASAFICHLFVEEIIVASKTFFFPTQKKELSFLPEDSSKICCCDITAARMTQKSFGLQIVKISDLLEESLNFIFIRVYKTDLFFHGLLSSYPSPHQPLTASLTNSGSAQI